MSQINSTTKADLNTRITGVVGAGILTLAMAFGVTLIAQNTSWFGSAPEAQVLGAQDSVDTDQPDQVEGVTVDPAAPEAIAPVEVAVPEPEPEPDPEPEAEPEPTPDSEPAVTLQSTTPVTRPQPTPTPVREPVSQPTPEPDPQPEPTPEPENPGNVGGTPEEPETPEDPNDGSGEPVVEDPDGSGGWTPERFCAETGEELGIMLIWNGEVCVDTSGQAIRRPVDPIVPIRPVDPSSLT